jgi:hypothetical protein
MRKCFFSLLTARRRVPYNEANRKAGCGKTARPVIDFCRERRGCSGRARQRRRLRRDRRGPGRGLAGARSPMVLLQSLFGPVHTLGQMRAPLASGVPPPKGFLLQSPHGPVFTLGKLLALKFSLAPR